jgi:hypothetical protein
VRKVKIAQTAPRAEYQLEEFRKLLVPSTTKSLEKTPPAFVAEAVVNSLQGVQSAKAVGRSSSAIGLAGALLQDPVGALSTKNPPDFAALFNTFYSLGGGKDPESAATLWFKAASHHAGLQSLAGIESALFQTTLAPFIALDEWPPRAPQSLLSSRATGVPEWWQREVLENSALAVGTPFSWFAKSWDRLCSPVWYEQLPPRRWAGWAICVMRNAMGFAFLWEANFFLEIARGVVDSKGDLDNVTRRSLVPELPLVPFQRGGIAQANVMPAIKKRLAMGLACRHALFAAAAKVPANCQSLREFIGELRGSAYSELRSTLKVAIAGDGYSGGLPNLDETVRYSLLDRGTVQDPDDYSLLRTVSGRFYHVSPGPEWIVVMAALSVPTPNPAPRLGDVRASLDALGFKPRIDFLLSELERAGLCASASDGDDGIEINLGFSGN